jgi:hopanoid C-3 methylase
MKILFVRPRPSKKTIGLQHVMIVEPLELEVLATLAGSANQPVIIDMILEKKSIGYFIRKENPDVFCVTGYITNVPGMINYCRCAKGINPEIITIAGGVHCEVCPQDLNDASIDYRVVRNATTVFPQLIDYLNNGNLFPKGVLRYNDQVLLDDLPPFDFFFPLPDRKLTDHYRKKYFYIFHDKVALIKTSFGCPFSCNFCFCREITRERYFERPLVDVMEELLSIKERNIYIVDDDFLTSRSRVNDFIEANRSASLDKNYLLYGRADFIAGNPDIMADFKAIGLKTVIVGFESFYDHELKNYHKNTDAKTNEEAMKVLNDNKIDCYATIIVSPDWGTKEFDFCGDKIRELGIHYVNLQPFTPLPGTGNTVEPDELIIPYSDYERWDLAHVTIRPKKMSPGDFYKNILRLYNSILFQPRFLIDYVKKYKLMMLLKMVLGSIKVRNQYLLKIKELKRNA